MRLEWEDPYNPGGSGEASSGKSVWAVAITVALVSAAVLGAFSWRSFNSVQYVTQAQRGTGTAGPTVNATGQPGFAALPQPPANDTSFSCGWAVQPTSVTCNVESGRGQVVAIALPLANPGRAPANVNLTYSVQGAANATWAASCTVAAGAGQSYVAPGSPLVLSPGTAIVSCRLTPPAPGAASFTAGVSP